MKTRRVACYVGFESFSRFAVKRMPVLTQPETRSREQAAELGPPHMADRHVADRVEAREEERRRVSRELHDEVGQKLALLELQITQIERDLAPDAGVRAALQSLRGRVVDIADDLHRICCRLHPAALEHLGLPVAVQSLCEEFNSSSAVKTRFLSCGVVRELPSHTALCLYRVVQEGLRNVTRHASATRAVVVMRSSAFGIETTITDNGRGFRTEEAARGGGLGLVSLQERVALAGGTFSIESAPGHGTRLRTWIPILQSLG
jgi:signal transduction histidine kinase